MVSGLPLLLQLCLPLLMLGYLQLPSEHQFCFCIYHPSGRPIQETCRYFEAQGFGSSGARPYLPALDEFCVSRTAYCEAIGGCPPSPAPLDHEAANMTGTLCSIVDNISTCSSLPPAPTPQPAPPPHVFVAALLDRYIDPSQAILGRELQSLEIRCATLCSTSTLVFLALDCSADPQAIAGPNGTATAALLGTEPSFTAVVDARDLRFGDHYKLCIDFDGVGSAYSFADSGLTVYISGIADVSPLSTLPNLTTMVGIQRSFAATLTLTCDAGCGSVSSGYLGKACADNADGYHVTVGDLSTTSATLGHRKVVNGSSVWFDAQRLVASDRALGAKFGAAVSISGDFLIVGAPGKNSDVGTAYIFERARDFDVAGVHPEPWVQVQQLAPGSGGDPVGNFGASVAASGNTIVAGVPHRLDELATDATGAAYVFTLGSTGTWQLHQVLKGHEEKGWWQGLQDRFGWACALDLETLPVLAVGAPLADDGALDAGSVFVFERNAAGTWLRVEALYADDAVKDDLFGSAVAVSGQTLVVGAPEADDGMSTSVGQVYVFSRSSFGTWTQSAKLRAASAGSSHNRFGTAVAVDAGHIVVGLPGRASGMPEKGALKVYEYNTGTTSWALTQTFEGQTSGAQLGAEVSMSDGWIAAAAPGDGSAGSVHFYALSPGSSWVWQQRLDSSLASSGDGFAKRVASAATAVPLSLDGGRLAIGAYLADAGGEAGAVHIFEIPVAAVEFALTLDTSPLNEGGVYKLCMDLDGFHHELRFGDTEFEVLIEPPA